MMSYLSSLLSPIDYIPHGICLLWQPELIALHVGSDAAIAIAYYSIPFALIYFVWKRTDLAFPGIFMLTGAFILACGTTHVMSIVTLWQPDYRLEGIIKLITALVSVATAFAMWQTMPLALALPSTAQLEQANRSLADQIAERKRAQAALRDMNEELERRVALRTTELQDEVAQRKRSEDALRQSEMYLAEAQRLSHTGSFGWDVSSEEVFWSDESFRIFGYDTDAKPSVAMVLQRAHPDDAALVQRTIDRAASDRRDFDNEHRLLMPDGFVKHLHVVAHAVADKSGQLQFVGALMDITEHKRVEAALRDSEQRFRDFTESASDWYWETGPDHRFITVPEQHNIAGSTPTHRTGTARWEFACDLEEEPEKWRLHLANLDAHKPFRDFRYRMTSVDGSEVHISTSGKPLFDPEGRFLGYRGVASHITAAVRAALLEEALQEAKVVGDNIAHDLRTPLTRVRLRLERGREHASSLEEFRAVADQAIASLDQSLTTITALLRITEIEHSRRREGFSEVQLAPLIREVGDLYDPIAEDKGVTLWAEAPDGATVHGDRDLLFEAVANLVDNAVKFTPQGGRVELVLLYQEGETVIRVIDTGPGIPEIEREAVTQRFYRSDKSRNIKGLGLGLSMVAAIVKLHGFRFTIAPGPGCTAEIAFPSH